MKTIVLVAVMMLVVFIAHLENVEAAGGFSLGCTLSCSIWNACRAKSALSGSLTQCGPEPSGCRCTSFYWE